MVTYMDHNFENQVRKYLEIRDAIKSLEPQLKEMEAHLKEYMAENGIKKVTVDGRNLNLVPVPGVRTFDADTLRKLISASVFNQVTEPKVKTDLFDAAVKLGKIPTDIADQVTNKTPYTQLRVN
jgi:hypothetical protein